MSKEKPIQILNQIFSEMINVKYISVETKAVSLAYAKKMCAEKGYDYHLVKKRGTEDLFLYDHKTSLVSLLSVNNVISDSTPILDVLLLLQKRPCLFVKEKQNITRIVTRADLNSIPVRIYLYGIISLFELQLRNYISSNVNDWKKSLSNERMQKANYLYELKKTRNEEIGLIECLQFCDLSVIVKKNWKYFQQKLYYFDRVTAVKSIKNLNSLRDELAHAQDISIPHDESYNLVLFMRRVLDDI